MAEESNNEDEDLEDRMYALLHYVDGSAAHINADTPPHLNPVITPLENGIRRYWKTSEQNASKSQYQKSNKHGIAAENVSKQPNIVKSESNNLKETCKENITKKSSETEIVSSVIIQEDDTPKNVTVLESSDEDEVVEVELAPQPTITIESSDEDEVIAIEPVLPKDETKEEPLEKVESKKKKKKKNKSKSACASPVPSVVSSISDDFIRSDCVAFNITSKAKETQKFDFNLHGTDLADNTLNNVLSHQGKKKKKDKKTPKSPSTSTFEESAEPEHQDTDKCFATPKNKAKKKKKKNKYAVSKLSLPEPDIYESDSSQSLQLDLQENAEKDFSLDISIMSADLDEPPAKIAKEQLINQESKIQDGSLVEVESLSSKQKCDEKSSIKEVTSNFFVDKQPSEQETVAKCDEVEISSDESNVTLDLTGEIDKLDDSLIIANITYNKVNSETSIKFTDVTCTKQATKHIYIPQIFNKNLDFNDDGRNNLNPNWVKHDMEKFYKESWGGEDFDHEEVKKSMSRDKQLWKIDRRDQLPTPKRKSKCGICNQLNHREDRCKYRPIMCHMCGNAGHYEPRCPRRMCVCCGTPNRIYTTSCRVCVNWIYEQCTICRYRGHTAAICPDLWRRYHSTIGCTGNLVVESQRKYGKDAHCSGCTGRGHFVHDCRSHIPFTSLPLFDPFVRSYEQVYVLPENIEKPQHPLAIDYLPLRSQSRYFEPVGNVVGQHTKPIGYEKNNVTIGGEIIGTPENRAKNVFKTSLSEPAQPKEADQAVMSLKPYNGPRSPAIVTDCVNTVTPLTSRKRTSTSSSGGAIENKKRNTSETQANQSCVVDSTTPNDTIEHTRAIPDRKVSNTVEHFGSAKIFVEAHVLGRLKTAEGQIWLNDIISSTSVSVEIMDRFLQVDGLDKDQVEFQKELRQWAGPVKPDHVDGFNSQENLPKSTEKTLQLLTGELNSLKQMKLDVKHVYKQYQYLTGKHNLLSKQKNISGTKLSNNRKRIKTCAKHLNMLFLGKEGLADGQRHLQQVELLCNKLRLESGTTCNNGLRQLLGHHFFTIFGRNPRDDYDALFREYKNKTNKGGTYGSLFREYRNKANKVHHNTMMFEIEKVVKLIMTTGCHSKELVKRKSSILNSFRDLRNALKNQPNNETLRPRTHTVLSEAYNFLDHVNKCQ